MKALLRIFSFIILTFFYTKNSFGAEVISLAREKVVNLKYGIVFRDPQMSDDQLMRSALSLVTAVQPKGINLELSNNQNYDFIIEVVDSKSVEREIDTARFQGAILDSSADAYTLVLADHPKGPYIVRLFWDKLMFEKKDAKLYERSDAFVRLTVAVAHEIFGNVKSFYDAKDVIDSPGRKYSNAFVVTDQVKFEIAAFRASVVAAQDLILLSERMKFPKKVVDDFKAALIREETALKSWVSKKTSLEAAHKSFVKTEIPLNVENIIKFPENNCRKKLQ